MQSITHDGSKRPHASQGCDAHADWATQGHDVLHPLTAISRFGGADPLGADLDRSGWIESRHVHHTVRPGKYTMHGAHSVRSGWSNQTYQDELLHAVLARPHNAGHLSNSHAAPLCSLQPTTVMC